MKTKLIILLLFINLFSCKKTEENQTKTYNEKINKSVPKLKKNHFPLARLNLVSNTKLGKINQILFGFKHSSLLN